MATMSKFFRSRLFWILVGVLVVWALVGVQGWLRVAEEATEDWRFRLRGPIESAVKVIYVDIDSQAVSELGSFPWERGMLAKVCRALVERSGVRGVGVDLVLSEAGVPQAVDRRRWEVGTVELWKLVREMPPVVLAASYAGSVFRNAAGELQLRELPRVGQEVRREVSAFPELPELRMPGGMVVTPPRVGLIDTIEGRTRTVPLFAPVEGRVFWHMSLELARLHLGVAEGTVGIGAEALELRDNEGKVVRRVPLREGQLLDINWFSPWLDDQRNMRISFADVYFIAEALESEDPAVRAEAEGFFGQEEFRDAVVLIGPVDPLLQDLATTPFDGVPVPKVGVHGNLVKTILNERYLKRAGPGMEAGLTLGLGAAVVMLAVGVASGWSRAAALGLLGGYALMACWGFAKWDWVLPLVGPLGAGLSASFVGVVVRLISEEKQKGRIKGLFGTYVAPELVERMVESQEEPQLGGVVERVTAYFSDIQSFSALSERLEAEALVDLMNEYLTVCTEVVQGEGGTLDKYIGDAVVAIYGAPVRLEDHAYRACVAALKVQQESKRLREKWRGEGERWPTEAHALQTRVGLNSGLAVVGNMGSATRFNYTMMGDDVNLAARMESGAKAYGVYTLVTEETRRQCEAVDKDGRVVFRRLDRIVVKGRSKPVQIHEAVGFAGEVTAEERLGLAEFERGLERYWAQDWQGAVACFGRSAEAERNRPGVTPGVFTNPSLIMKKRCEWLRLEPPGADWDGVFVMTSK